MSFQVKEPVLVIGLGGAGSKLAIKAKDSLNSDCLLISNDSKDFIEQVPSVHVSTDSVVNPSMQLIRGSTYNVSEEIKSKISGYSTVVMMSNLAGKAGSAIAPVVSEMCKEANTGLISFAIMPFKYEKDRIFNSGVSLKRVRENSECTVVLDNDSLLESNPDLTPKACYDIANSAIMHVVESLGASELSSETNILTTSKQGQDIEESLRDSLKMLYGNAPPNAVKRSMLYVVGGSNIPVGVLNSITNLTSGILNESNSQIDMTSESEESKVVMLSSIQGMTKFDNYDPLGMIPQEDTLDWSAPDCSIDCELDLPQLE
ncbi:Cell division protein FtsZ 1 [Marine Group I thaumarchaeote SCGC AAA799-E16]|uniref:Cell division protein FtsZ 1 n=3 Tax=Marine Group I TaxID=905826 RepID=A0A087RQC7_9ARCH|nr:Cell division protein FtsZ 1 [Marine Group I thaumarchaeote SCGC AAA799-E16]KFM15681.1 Cell division protein FtsZ 1 [Marine Group I thaumarchaeote SCGC AAA799-D11]KFM16958.1 Cell division protein FtsZ 1 [Marine Group I thaumarchaeote SCGC RSA3]